MRNPHPLPGTGGDTLDPDPPEDIRPGMIANPKTLDDVRTNAQIDADAENVPMAICSDSAERYYYLPNPDPAWRPVRGRLIETVHPQAEETA